MGSSPLQRITHRWVFQSMRIIVEYYYFFIIINYCWRSRWRNGSFRIVKHRTFGSSLQITTIKRLRTRGGPFVVGSVFGQHSHTWVPSINLMLKVIINEKSVFVDPSHTFCLSRYHASEGFGLFSDNTHTLCAFLKIYVEDDKLWQMNFRRHLSHILCVVIWCFIWLV